MDTSPSTGSVFGLLVYFFFLLTAVFIGPLEAVLGLGLYWLYGDDAERRRAPR
ncbi:hypothetical protein C486_06748 [Natrinema gari JCM 14663]|uniref:Uncharacterized protein n=1 Tax=Natrinema gari JCM 14663 TaxID=1230459 RepID=L9Z7Q0_9EURY|nr:hypothetical protein C486_06748 [Natrinema gari JCM 14663]